MNKIHITKDKAFLVHAPDYPNYEEISQRGQSLIDAGIEYKKIYKLAIANPVAEFGDREYIIMRIACSDSFSGLRSDNLYDIPEGYEVKVKMVSDGSQIGKATLVPKVNDNSHWATENISVVNVKGEHKESIFMSIGNEPAKDISDQFTDPVAAYKAELIEKIEAKINAINLVCFDSYEDGVSTAYRTVINIINEK